MFFVVQEGAQINITICINLNPMTIPLINFKVSFIDFSLILDKDAFSVAYFPLNFAKVYFVRAFDESDLFHAFVYDLFEVYFAIDEGAVVHEEVTELGLGKPKHFTVLLLLL